MTKAEFEDFSKEHDLLIDFYADWCGPCKFMKKVIDDAWDKLKDVTLDKVNVDCAPQLAADFGVTSIPTIFCYRKGKCVAKFVGVVEAEKIVEAFKGSIA